MRSATRRGVIAAAFLLGLGLPGLGARADDDPPARQETPTGADQETSSQRSGQESASTTTRTPTDPDDPDPSPGAGGMEPAPDPSPDPSGGAPTTKPGPSAEERSLARARRQWLESIWRSP